jgi:cobalt-zinc-cadmium efflux system membrane fusion protein
MNGYTLLTVPSVLFAITLAGCAHKTTQDDPPAVLTQSNGTLMIPQGSPLRSSLVFDTARTVARSDVIWATGSVESDPAHTVRILPPMTGRIVALHVHLGDVVRRGEPLLTLESPDFTSAQADYAHAITAFRQAKNTVTRERDLAQYGIAAQRDVEQAETDFSQAQGDLHRALAHLTLLGMDSATALRDQALVIRSPIAGRVTELSVGLGEFHNDPAASVMTVADLATVWLTANVPEKDIHAIHIGDRATAVLAAYPSDTLRGTVASVGTAVDTTTRVTKVRLALANPGERLKPGMYATVSLAGRPAPTIVVPATALLQVRDSSYVFIETAPWTLERRSVVLGLIDSGRAIVRDGVVSGQRLVARDAVLLQ